MTKALEEALSKLGAIEKKVKDLEKQIEI